jgi:hypothetical protein
MTTQDLRTPHKHGSPTLPFTVEDKPYTSGEQYLTGARIKEIAGLPKDAELFLTIGQPWKDDAVADEEVVDLARPGLEGFYIKKRLKFTINGCEHETDRQYITGHQIRHIGSIPPDYQLFLFIEGPYEDELIEDDSRVNLARPGRENFISKPKPATNLIINAQLKSWRQPTISFEQVVELAFGVYSEDANKSYTVAYSNGPANKPKGVMVTGDIVHIKNEMKFDVSATDKS